MFTARLYTYTAVRCCNHVYIHMYTYVRSIYVCKYVRKLVYNMLCAHVQYVCSSGMMRHIHIRTYMYAVLEGRLKLLHLQSLNNHLQTQHTYTCSHTHARTHTHTHTRTHTHTCTHAHTHTHTHTYTHTHTNALRSGRQGTRGLSCIILHIRTYRHYLCAHVHTYVVVGILHYCFYTIPYYDIQRTQTDMKKAKTVSPHCTRTSTAYTD